MVTVSDRTPWLAYGSPSAPIYSEGAFQYHKGTDDDAIYQLIPPETEVLITHTPPRDVLDRTRRGVHAGCEQLAAHLPRLANLRLLVFGHIHEGHGAVLLEIGDPLRVVVAVNAAVAREGQPVVVDLKNVC